MTTEATKGPDCPAVLNLLGEHFDCDWPTDAGGTHTGWAHTSSAAQAVWTEDRGLTSENRLLRDELEHLRAKLECSQRLADQAIKERDQMRSLAAETGREYARLANIAREVARTHDAGDISDLWPALDRLTVAVTPVPEPEHLHDGTRADKAIRPRGAA